MNNVVGSMYRRRGLTCVVILIYGMLLTVATDVGTCGQLAANEAHSAFEVADYEKVRDIHELAISSDGEYIAFIEALHCYEGCARAGKVYVMATEPGSTAQYVQALDGANELAWKPRSHILAALLWRNGKEDVYNYSVVSRRVRPVTDSSTSVVYFAYSQDGALAYMDKKGPRRASERPIYWLAQYGKHGIVVDPETTGIASFRDPTVDSGINEKWIAPNVLRIVRGTRPPVSMSVPGTVESFAWSPKANDIVVTYVADGVSPALGGLGSFFRSLETSVGIVSVSSGQFKIVAAGSGAGGVHQAVWYATGAWTQDGRRIVLLRFGGQDPPLGSYYADWTAVDPFHASSDMKNSRWATLELPYPADESTPSGAAQLVPDGRGSVLVDAPAFGRYNLYAFNSRGATMQARISFNGDVGETASSEEGRVLAFVGQDIATPPEVYVLKGNGGAVRVTEVNAGVQEKVRYKKRLVRWFASDGSLLSGWLLEPKDTPSPWPVLTLVHGGPKYPMTDSFAKYFEIWPFPVEALASHGIAVFEPNYRGTTGFGWRFAAPKPSEVPQMAVVDVMLGIAHLEEAGIADPKRLGICGQSYGDWLGALVMEKFRGFVAASLAEGSGDQVIDYSLLPGDFVRYAWDPDRGSYYGNPLSYLEQSVDLHVQGVSTALMLASGAYSEVELGLTMGKAARDSGEPVEWVVYPHTGHNIADPSLLREAAGREFAWFEFWLRGAVEPDMVSDRELQLWQRWRRARSVTR